ncbi:uncharacterized protein LOC119382267 [Rhipicephalus sanguineus]|uniref:uncharacterized protein LOC119382267 n=1 Tax=Rhipicephalus sanguineus TaxID=34632 RepID=UPI0020C4E816|nr:uncharacterized protein LOC119382267 [Rhipicephalus sanguineus]
MPNKCCVPQCRGNYDSTYKVRVFRFPQDDELRRKWLRAIPRDSFIPSQYSRVCELHFAPEDITQEASYIDEETGRTVTAPLLSPRILPGVIPSKFPSCPAFLSKECARRESPDSKRQLSRQHLQNQRKHLAVTKRQTQGRQMRNLCVPPTASSKRVVTEFLDSVEAWDTNVAYSPTKRHTDEIVEAISFLLSKLSTPTQEDNGHAIQFLTEQLKLLSKNKVRRRYSTQFMVFCCLLFTISPHAYKFMRSYGTITMPHPMTIRSICSSHGMNPQLENEGSTFLRYMKTRISDLDERQRAVTLMLDEIHIKPFFDYKGGNIAGIAQNSPEAATSAMVFMVQSICCNFKEVAHIVPVRGATGIMLHNSLREVIRGLERIGYRVICVVTDNNKVNRKAMEQFASGPISDSSSFVYPHPCDPKRPLFFIIDPVHILKCVRNNWIRQRNHKQCFYFPEFEQRATSERRMISASFGTIVDIYNIEVGQLLRHAYTLSRKALFPTDIEKQNVKLALQVLNETVPPALREIGNKHNLYHVEGTAMFIEIITKWWKVVNVKTPSKGARLRDEFQEPVFSVEDRKIDFLYNFLDWMEEWKKRTKDCDSGTLTKETHAGLHQTTQGLIEIVRYCLDELKLSYVLLGKIQTDCLEDRFGKYRQLAGSHYHVSIRQVYECENKLRLQSTLPTVATSRSVSEEDEEWQDLDGEANCLRPKCNVVVTEETLTKMKDIIPVLVYVAGYAVYAALKKLKCQKCREALTLNKAISVSVADKHYDLIRAMDRGGLVHPTMFVVNAVAHNYAVVEQLSKQEVFLKLSNQRQVVTDLTVELLSNDESSDFDACDDGHSCELVLKYVLWCSTNILLKSFCCRMNDKILESHSKSKKRKLETLSKK